ncbi:MULTISPECIES: FMN-binding negative transcriptional regulator [Vibrio]|uniref:FMN-binding negative transcriptional regulator n=1 Tax=Vibrio TaxID=662 RepID=UPI001C58F7B1|nr:MULTISPECIES: FMN-binding negative transcriptional regulator [Vibrio]
MLKIRLASVDSIEQLTTKHEQGQAVPWSMSDAPEGYIHKMLPAVVGVEIEVESLSGQWKLSQNHPEINQQGVVEGLSSKDDTNSQVIASLMSANL